MKSEGGLVVGLGAELTTYFKQHPEALPLAVDLDSLEIKCSSYLIEHIEDYATKPFTDKFLWSLRFPTSTAPEFEYLYFITCRAMYKGGCSIIEACPIFDNKLSPVFRFSTN